MSETFDDDLTAPRLPGEYNEGTGGGVNHEEEVGGAAAGSAVATGSSSPNPLGSPVQEEQDDDEEMPGSPEIHMPKVESDDDEDGMSDVDVQDVTLQGDETGVQPQGEGEGQGEGGQTPGPPDDFSDDDDTLGFTAADVNMDDIPSGKREASNLSGGENSDTNREHDERQERRDDVVDDEEEDHNSLMANLDADVVPSDDEGSDQDWRSERKRLKKKTKKRNRDDVGDVDMDEEEREMQEPKPAKLAFSFFVQAIQNSEEFDDADDSTKTQLLQRRWADISEEEKQIYQSKENQDKLRYSREKEDYLKIHPDWKPQKKRLNPQRQPRQQRQAVPQERKKKKRRRAAENNPLMPANQARLAQERQERGEVYQDESQERSMTYFDEVVERMKPNRRRGKELTGDELNAMAKMFLHQMNDAYEDDIKLNNERKPAFNKLSMLPEVVAQVNKIAIRTELLNQNEGNNGGLLARFRDWLKPLPNGSLPSMKVRSEIYRLLDKMDIDTDNLVESEGLGVELINLWKHPKETPENKKALHRLIEKWCRMIFGRETDYKHLGQGERERKHEIRARVNSLRRSQTKYDDKKRMRARVPERAWFDFAVRPRGKLGENDGTSSSSNKLTRRKRIEKKLIRIEKSTGVRRASKVSVSAFH